MNSRRIEPGPGQESVWDYPRPPALEHSERHVEVFFNNILIADSSDVIRVLETSSPPVYYIPESDIEMKFLAENSHRTFCEWKGVAHYYDLKVHDKTALRAAWHYPDPVPDFAELKNHIAFYAQKMDRCFVDGEIVKAQSGDFYGGWITSDIVGPFKGEPGTEGW